MGGLRAFSIGVLMVCIFPGCQKPEGYGGTGFIEGTLFTRYYNDDLSLMIGEEPAVDEEVFLLFGDEEFLGDRIFTSHTGAFRFEFLRQGAYTLYFSSEDTLTGDPDNQVLMLDLELARGEHLQLDTLFRKQILDFNDGHASISGVIRKVNYRNESEYPFLEVKDTSFAQEQEVYLLYGDHAFYDERIRTDYRGYFEFRDLIQGEYTVFVYSEDLTGGTGDIPVIMKTTIARPEEQIDLGEILIYQL